VFHFIVSGIEVGSNADAGLRPVVYKDFAPSQFLGRFFSAGHVEDHDTAAPPGFAAGADRDTRFSSQIDEQLCLS
jgi:hypothetical protein